MGAAARRRDECDAWCSQGRDLHFSMPACRTRGYFAMRVAHAWASAELCCIGHLKEKTLEYEGLSCLQFSRPLSVECCMSCSLPRPRHWRQQRTALQRCWSRRQLTSRSIPQRTRWVNCSCCRVVWRSTSAMQLERLSCGFSAACGWIHFMPFSASPHHCSSSLVFCLEKLTAQPYHSSRTGLSCGKGGRLQAASAPGCRPPRWPCSAVAERRRTAATLRACELLFSVVLFAVVPPCGDQCRNACA